MILANLCAFRAGAGVEGGMAQEHIGKGKNWIHYKGRQNRKSSSHNIKMRGKNPSQLHLVWGFLRMRDFLFYSALWSISWPARLGRWALKPCCGRWNQAVLSGHWTPETATHWVSASVFIATLGRVSLRGWSSVMPPLSHRVSLKVQ